MQRILLASFLAVSALTAAAADPSPAISRQPPVLYAERVQPLLTPLAEVKALPRSSSVREAASTETLLEETIGYLEDSGRGLLATHRIRSVITEPGVKALAEDSTTFLTGAEKLHIAQAHTIRADGTTI